MQTLGGEEKKIREEGWGSGGGGGGGTGGCS